MSSGLQTPARRRKVQAQLHAVLAAADPLLPDPLLHPAGEPTTDITEQDGKRIIRRTGMYTGTELHLTR